MKKTVWTVILSLAAIFASCKEPAKSTFISEPVVYVGGSYTDNGQEKACYWVNGKRHELNGLEVENITASGGIVYAAGSYMDGGIRKTCYWANGVRKDISGCSVGVYNSFGPMSADRGNIYISGWDDINEERCYWVNGVRHAPPVDGIMNGVYAANGSVYMVGYFEGDVRKPCYWVGGIRAELPNKEASDSNPDFITGSITVANGKVYIMCNFIFSPGNGYDIYSSYWINGVQQKVIFDGIRAFAISDDNVYMSGGYLYINGERSDRVDAAVGSFTEFAVSSGKIYTLGDGACYWVDGVRHDLDGTSARAIYVEE